MNRLTAPNDTLCTRIDCYLKLMCTNNPRTICTERSLYDRLQAYENTGLTPEQVQEIAEKHRSKSCSSCEHYEIVLAVCGNCDSIACANEVKPDDTCKDWEEKRCGSQ